MARDLLADYTHAQVAALGWSETARLTGSSRHLETALVCAKIARERLEVMLMIRPELALEGSVVALAHRVGADIALAQSPALITEARAILGRLHPASVAAE